MPTRPPVSLSQFVRWLLVPAALVSLGVFLLPNTVQIRETVVEIQNNQFNLPPRAYNIATKACFDLRLDLAKNWNGSNTTLLAMLWGLFLLKGEKSLIARNDFPELGVFFIAHVPILLHWWVYSKYVELMTWVMRSGSANAMPDGTLVDLPDFMDTKVDVFSQVQQLAMIAAAALVAALIVMIFFLKGDGHDQNNNDGTGVAASSGAVAGR